LHAETQLYAGRWHQRGAARRAGQGGAGPV